MKPSAVKVLRLLQASGDTYVCGVDLIEARVLRYGARVYELREAGHRIETVRCRSHGTAKYRLEPTR